MAYCVNVHLMGKRRGRENGGGQKKMERGGWETECVISIAFFCMFSSLFLRLTVVSSPGARFCGPAHSCDGISGLSTRGEDSLREAPKGASELGGKEEGGMERREAEER